MTPVEGLVLGLVQGLTEFLPISSSGHLVIAQTLFGVHGSNVAFDAAVHGATLLAILVYFRTRIARLIAARDWEYAGKLAVGTVPVVLVGGIFRHDVERAFVAPWIVPLTLAATGTLLLSLYLRRSDRPPAPAPSWIAAVLIGCAQSVALLPGISRSGSTIVAALWLGVAAPAAAEFSFLLGIPALAGAVVLQSGAMAETATGADAGALSLGVLAAFASGLVAIALVFHLLARQGFRRFGFYCWGVAAAFGAWLWLGGVG